MHGCCLLYGINPNFISYSEFILFLLYYYRVKHNIIYNNIYITFLLLVKEFSLVIYLKLKNMGE